MKNIIQAKSSTKITIDTISQANHHLQEDGWALLRGFETNIDVFSHTTAQLCRTLTFDPAREYGNQSTQKVNAGTASIGLHIENGNTPIPPDLVAFFSRKSAKSGSQTTICDGVDIYNALREDLKEKFSHPISVSRTLPPHLWKQYIANEHPDISNVMEVEEHHLEDILNTPNQKYELLESGKLHYTLTVDAFRSGAFSNRMAFANAILGPSFNYERPTYRFQDGTEISQEIKSHIADTAEIFTHEIQWQNGDIALIDNKRVMHGRREIQGSLEERELFIGMGLI